MNGFFGKINFSNINSIEELSPDFLLCEKNTARYIDNKNNLLEISAQSSKSFFHYYDSGNFFVCIYGCCFLNQIKLTSSCATRLRDNYFLHGFKALDGLSGSYNLILIDYRNGYVVIQNDKLGSIPLHYSLNDTDLLFGHNSSAIISQNLEAFSIDQLSAVSLLREGYPLTNHTLFLKIQRLAPAHRVLIDIKTKSARISPYWNLDFRPETSLSLPTATHELYDLVIQSHKIIVSDAPNDFGVFLTGGMDSRGMAGALDAIGMRPAMSLTWCGKKDVAHSDPAIASRIAGHYGFPHQTIHVDADELAVKALEWLRIGELTTDNLGFYTASPDVFHFSSGPNPPFYLVGDEFFGHGGTPSTVEEATSYVLKSADSSASHWLRGCLREEISDEVDEAFSASVQQLLSPLPNRTPRNVVDWLTYYVHRPCWSYSAGNCKEPTMAVRRPFMADEIIEFVSTFPEALRNDKTVYYEMLRRYMPQTLRFPRTTADSLFDWPRRFRNHAPTREFLLNAIRHEALLDGPMSRYLDADAILSFTEAYFSQEEVNTSHRFFGHHAVNVRRWLGKNPYTRGATQHLSNLIKKPNKSTQLNPTHLVRRLALLSLFIQELENGGFSRIPSE